MAATSAAAAAAAVGAGSAAPEFAPAAAAAPVSLRSAALAAAARLGPRIPGWRPVVGGRRESKKIFKWVSREREGEGDV